MTPTHDKFTSQYIATALWSSIDGEDPLDANYGPEDLGPSTLQAMVTDCIQFQQENEKDIDGRDSRAGHDFWLTRNGHGAGFWDGDWPEPQATRLTDACKAFGEFNLYVGDDKVIYHL